MTLLRHLGCLLLGGLVALASLAVHRSLPPAELLIALVTTYAVAWWLLRTRHPTTAVSYVVGWLVVIAAVVGGRPEGDFVIGSDVEGYGLLAGAFGLIVVGIVSFAGGRSSRT